MVIHYSSSPETAACGRATTSQNSSADAAQVSCKLCLRSIEKQTVEPARKTPSLAELRAAAKAEKAAAAPVAAQASVASAIPAKPAKPATVVVAEVAQPASVKSARAEWQQRLAQMPGRNRLPRGKARQAFI